MHGCVLPYLMHLHMHHNILKRLDLAIIFKGLTIITLTDEEKQDDTQQKEAECPFYYLSLSP